MSTRINSTLLVLVAGGAILIGSCADSKHLSESQIRARYKDSRSLNETAAFLAGIPLSRTSPLYRLTENDQYRAYRQYINGIWVNYREKNLNNIEVWRKKHVKDDGAGLVMYPFSGPDILNALAFFPGADEYVMIGLEQPGNVPNPLRYQGPNIYMELWKIKNALRTILQLNLFRTIEMAADFKADSFSNITGIMMFFLARYEYQILDIRKVSIDLDGNIRRGDSKQGVKGTDGVEFTFRKRSGTPVQTARFFSVDLSDGSLTRLKGVSAFLSKRKGFTTFIKSASYLLSYDNFRILRSYLLAGSRYIIQEDSGIPYKYFDTGDWSLSFYGTYRVIAIFASRFQRDLDAAVKLNNRGPLPFDFGYGFEPDKSNIMIAVRKPKKG